MKSSLTFLTVLGLLAVLPAAAQERDAVPDAPSQEEQQLPFEMRSPMETLPRIRVGHEHADLIGRDNRVLQAAVEYIAALGGGVVEIGPGEYVMRDSLHLRSHVTVRGVPGKTILRKADGEVSRLALDGDFGEQQITLQTPEGFEVGYGVAIWDDRAGGFHTSVARITGRTGATFAIDTPLGADCMVHNQAQAATVFPVLSGYHVREVRVEGLTIDGNKDANVHLNGCRGGGIFFYGGHGAVIENCRVYGYQGDGISFQQSNDVTVSGCESSDNAELGFHPGSGSQRATIRGCVARNNGTDGLFLCWRVRHGLFEDNLLEGNGRFGISIGHKDSDNLVQKNRVRLNGQDGVFFRNETYGMAAHRNRIVENVIEDNGADGTAAGIRIRGQTEGLQIENNMIRDTRADPTQTVGVLIEAQVLEVKMEGNQIEARQQVKDQRQAENSGNANSNSP